MKKYLIIVADTNDADYITSKHIVDDETIEKIKPVIEAIKNFKPYRVEVNGMKWSHDHNYTTQERTREDMGGISARDYYVGKNLVTKEEFEIFDELVPFDEYGIHTIESIDILEVFNEYKLL